jgi:hypothetical protein
MGRPQQKSEPPPPQPGLKVVANTPSEQPAAPKPAELPEHEAAAEQARQSQAAARHRLHPSRIWPD